MFHNITSLNIFYYSVRKRMCVCVRARVCGCVRGGEFNIPLPELGI